MRKKHGADGKSFGDDLRSKPDSVCRMIFLNIDGVGKNGDSFKMEAVHQFIEKHDVDVLALQELKIDWRKILYKDSMWHRVKEWKHDKVKMSLAHNIRSKPRRDVYQSGGTAVLGMNALSQCHTERGQDSRRLGRWSWLRIRGKGGVTTRIVSVYCPCYNKRDQGSAYQQQVDYFLSQKMTVCPRKQFWTDLQVDIEQWQATGDQIVIGGDWNHHLNKVNKKLRDFGLSEAITSAHGLRNAPKTHMRGSKPIDGIYLSSTLIGVKCGYLPFYKGGITSDHRGLWVDIPMDSAIGFDMVVRSPKAARRLKLQDPRVVKRYQEDLHSYAVQHKLYEKGATLLRQSTYPLPAKLQEKYAKLDHQRILGMRRAEKRCRKLRLGKYQWSPAFQRIRRLIVFWTLMTQRSKGHKIHKRRLLRLLKRLDLEDVDFDLPHSECKAQLDALYKEYANIKSNSVLLRETYLEDLARAMADGNEKLIASKLRALKHREEQRRVAKAIKFTTEKLFGQGTTKVVLEHADGSTTDVIDEDELNKVLISSNQRKYHRTEPYCEFLSGRLREDIGLCGEGPAVPAVLNGTYYPPDGLSKGMRLFLDHMKQPPLSSRAQQKASYTSLEEFQWEWRKAKETSSSCGDIHYGHYKAGCSHHSLGYLHFTMAQISLESGCYLARHKQGIDVMLLKKEGDYRLHRLRTICLFDAEFNMNNGRVGRAGLAATIEAGDMSDEQYSRPCRSSLDHVVNRILTFNYFTYGRRPFGMCSCDLAGNYDRIVHAAASLALQRIGVPKARVVGMFHTIQRLVKRVRTAFGDSAFTYGGEDIEHPFLAYPQGVYQGNRNGPPVWSILSSTVFAILRKAGFGVQFISAISKDLFHLCGFAFVDDSDLVQEGESVFEVAKDMQAALELWEDVMHATGQAMAPEKSWWYLVDFAWSHGQWVFADGNVRTDLVAHNSDGKPISLKRLIFSQATKMLGVFLAPNGCMKAQVTYLREKGMKWADYIRSGHLSRSETAVALKTCIWKTILYPLVATTFTADEITAITWPIISAALPKMGYCRNLALELRYGPRNLGGVGIANPLLIQGIRKIAYIVEHPWKGTPTGTLLLANLEALSLECGVYGNLLAQPSRPLDWMSFSSSWLQFAWKFMDEHDIVIYNMPGTFLCSKRYGDSSLMAAFESHGFDDGTLRRLNRCRLFLQVVSVSDISCASGQQISPHVLFATHRRPPARLFRRYNFRWPRQGCPSRSDWILWDTAIGRCFCGLGLTLNQPLGKWFRDSVDQAGEEWDWFVFGSSPQSFQSLWHYNGSTWTVFQRLGRARRQRTRFQCVGRTRQPPSVAQVPYLHRASIHKESSYYALTSWSNDALVPATFGPARDPSSVASLWTTFTSLLSARAEASWLLDSLILEGSFEDILSAFRSGNLSCVSDGSFFQSHKDGGASWVLETHDQCSRLRGSCLTPGQAGLQSAFRSELTGLLGISLYVWALCQLCRGDRPSDDSLWDIIIGCDGYSALSSALLGNPERLSTQNKHFDIVAAIMGVWKDLPCKAFPFHIRGHLDISFSLTQLTRPEQLNIAMDACAKSHVLESRGRGHTPCSTPQFSFGLPTVVCQGHAISSQLATTLHDLCTREDLVRYWCRKWRFTPSDRGAFAWHPFMRAYGGVSDDLHTFVTKWLSRQIELGTGSTKRSRCGPSGCPRCGSAIDDAVHCLRCPRARSCFLLHFGALCEDLRASHWDDRIVEGIAICTHLWLHPSRRQNPAPLLQHLPSAISAVLCKQFSFGWFSFLQGLHLSSLTDLLDSSFQSAGSLKSAPKWHALLIRSCWKILHALYMNREQAADRLLNLYDPRHEAVAPALKRAKIELARGQRSIPPLYSQYFQYTPDRLDNLNAVDLQRWLRVVLLSREAGKDSLSTTDCFSPTGQHRSWLMSSSQC